MAKYIIMHGSVLSKDGNLGVGEPIELDKKDLERMDPTKERFCTPEVWAKLQKADEAAREALEMQKTPPPEDKPEEKKPKAKK